MELNSNCARLQKLNFEPFEQGYWFNILQKLNFWRWSAMADDTFAGRLADAMAEAGFRQADVIRVAGGWVEDSERARSASM